MCTGDVCYIHKQLKNDGIIYTDWHCLEESNPTHHIDAVCNRGAFNTDIEAYACCSDVTCAIETWSYSYQLSFQK